MRPPESLNYYHEMSTLMSYDIMNFYRNYLISGDNLKNWTVWLSETYPKFNTCLSINCGNGWVERELFLRGVFDKVVGIDILEESLKTASDEALRINMPAEYVRMDINNDDLPYRQYDLVINHAAFHHVARIDRLCRMLCKAMPINGMLINFDYTGPSRNQYKEDAWRRIIELDDASDEVMKHGNLIYPQIETMLKFDPTEAIHSDLIIPTLKRYFFIDRLVPLGGAIAYPLLHDHRNLYQMRDTEEGSRYLRKILDLDIEYTDADPDKSLFTFSVMRPNKASLLDQEKLNLWELEEDSREQAALQNSGRYYPKNYLEIIYRKLTLLEYKIMKDK